MFSNEKIGTYDMTPFLVQQTLAKSMNKKQ